MLVCLRSDTEAAVIAKSIGVSRFPSQKQLILLVLLISGVLLLVLVFSSGAEPSGERSIFGPLSLKEHPTQERDYPSNYERSKDTQASHGKLRYKEQRRKENPFFSFYREEQASAAASNNPVTAKKRNHQRSFFDFMNSAALDKSLFAAVFRERQRVQPGKALRLFLEEPIDALKLKVGTVLKGIPELAGDRIKITVTAAQVGGTMKPVELLCLDQEDCLEGLYHDALAARQEQATQESLVEELWGLTHNETLQKGRRIAQKLTHSAHQGAPIVIDSGKGVFVMLPPRENH